MLLIGLCLCYVLLGNELLKAARKSCFSGSNFLFGELNQFYDTVLGCLSLRDLGASGKDSCRRQIKSLFCCQVAAAVSENKAYNQANDVV